MPILSARKIIDLSPKLFVQRTKEEILFVEYSLDEYDIRIDFEVDDMAGSVTNTETGIGKYLVNRLIIVASKGVEFTPDIPKSESGARDFTTLQPYFDEKLKEYGPVILNSFRRLLSYFKYNLNQPFLDPEHLKNNQFHDMEWFDSSGNDYGAMTLTLDGGFQIGLIKDALEVSPYESANTSSLIDVLIRENDEELQYQILSDAQSAIIGKNLRRGVFEMAVSSELSVKRAFFSKYSFSGDAFEYLEDKGKVKVTVLEFISSVAEEVFGESFRASYPDDYNNIDYLFRCRNKIAHRGELVFKNDSGVLNEVSFEMTKEWYFSVRNLLRWLDNQKGKNAT